MRSLPILFCAFLLVLSCKKQVTDYPEALAFQAELNQQYGSEEESPLTEEDRKHFKALEFFQIDSKYRVNAKLERVKDSEPFTMKTTTDRLPIYKLYGIAHFEIDGKPLQLEIYQSQQLILDPVYENYLFLPYTDLTNGKGSYGGGRYIDLESSEGDEIIIDFNQSYNPYCAYNKKYSCPIPPEVNHLDIRIEAGVKAWDHH